MSKDKQPLKLKGKRGPVLMYISIHNNGRYSLNKILRFVNFLASHLVRSQRGG